MKLESDAWDESISRKLVERVDGIPWGMKSTEAVAVDWAWGAGEAVDEDREMEVKGAPPCLPNTSNFVNYFYLPIYYSIRKPN